MSGGPEHIYRNPRIQPKADAIARQSFTTELPTRSAMKPMTQKKPYAANVDDLLLYATANCVKAFENIQVQCRDSGKKFFDRSFYFGDRNAMYPNGSPNDCTVSEPTAAKRLHDLFPTAPLFSDASEASDITQGAVGDCFFIGAVSALASSTAQHLNPVGRLFAASDAALGMYGVLFFKNSGFEWVIVDDFIAVDVQGKPLYAAANENELWPMILEKAYAKMHYCWDSIDGGWEREALADMTGGKEFQVNLTVEKKITFDLFRQWVDNPLIVLGCAVGQQVQEVGGAGRAGESGAVYGLFKGHAYSVIGAAQCSDGKGFLRVRNPWGNECEWTGDYSDRSTTWKTHPLHAKELNPEAKDDGAFWICWEDFKKYFTDVDVCEFYDRSTLVVTQYGRSSFTSGAAQTFIVNIKVKDATSNARIPTVVTLGQEDPKAQPDHKLAKSGQYATMKMRTQPLSREPSSMDDIKNCVQGVYTEAKRGATRQVDDESDLRPGWYAITVNITNAREGLGYFVRLFAPVACEVAMYRMDDKAGTVVSIGQIVSTVDPAVAAADVAGRNAGKGNVGPAPPVAPTPAPVVPTPAAVQPSPTPAVQPIPTPAPAAVVLPAIVEERVVRGNGPEHIYRQPKCTPDLMSLVNKYVTFNEATASLIRPMRIRTGEASTVGMQLEVAARACQAQVRKIVTLCESSQCQFIDKTFYYSERRNLYPNGSPEDCTVTEPNKVKRLSELYPDAPLFGNRSDANDIDQGSIGDCFFIGAVSALASCTAQHLDPLRRLFPAYDTKWGVFGVCFFKNGGWEWTIVDDYIAIDPESGAPLYANATEKELWPMVVEKAYAKIHTCWDTIDGGWGREALADMTGGTESAFSFSTHPMAWSEFKHLVDNPLTVICCAVSPNMADQGGSGRAGEAGTVFGLFKGHAYSVIQSKECSDGTGFVRVRNPWGNSAEWKGPFGDNDKAWKQFPDYFKQVNPNFAYDGCFWMKFDDFKKYFTEIDIVTYFDPSYEVVTVFGTNAADLTPQQTYVLNVDSDDGQPVHTVITLGQEDPKLSADHNNAKNGKYSLLRFSLYKLTRQPTSFDDLKNCLGEKVVAPTVYNRQVDNSFTLAPGLYSAVPKLTKGSPSVGYYVRAFCPPNAQLKMYRMDKPADVFSTGLLAAGATGNATKMLKGTVRRVVAPQGAATGADDDLPSGFTVTFDKSGGIDKASATAFELADPWHRGAIDRRMAEQAFAQLLMNSDLGVAFSNAAAQSPQLDTRAFNALVKDVLTGSA